MNDVKQGGFTIIELMLFISISALMTITLLVGWSVAINTQSYRDATRSLSSTLQTEYNQTVNVVGERGAGYTCSRGGASVNVATSPPVSGQSRGTTDCIVMGRYVVLDGTTVKSNAVLGIAPTAPIVSGTDDKAVITAYLPTRIDSSLIEGINTFIPWIDATYKSSSDRTSVKLAILIVRSPETGTTYTYHREFTNSEPTAAAILANGSQAAKTICLDPGAPIAQPRSAVIIGANAASTTAINTSTDVATTDC